VAALLSICTKEEQLALITFLSAEGLSGAEISCGLSIQYKNSALRKVLCLNGLLCLQPVAQVSLMLSNPDTPSCPLLIKALNESVP
jgi:hypothetical protein